MKITKRQLKRIIREAIERVDDISPTARNYRAYADQSAPAPIRGEHDSNWIIWAEQYDLYPEYDNEGQLHFYLDVAPGQDSADLLDIVSDAENLGASVEEISDGQQYVIYTGEYR